MKKNYVVSDNKIRDYCVYRYLLKGTKKVVYVGKTNSSLRARITAHKYEKKFRENEPYDVEYIELSNSVETDCIEKFLINEWKPLLNEKDNVGGLTQGFSLENLKWMPYDYYNGASISYRQIKEIIRKANEKTEFLKFAIYAALNNLSNGLFIVPQIYNDTVFYFSGSIKSVVNMYVQKIDTGYVYQLNQNIKDELIRNLNQIVAAIWWPVFRLCNMTENQELEYVMLSEELEFSDRIKEFAMNGYEDERSLYQYDMAFDKISEKALSTYQSIFADVPYIGQKRCSVEIDRFAYEEYFQLCRENTASKVLDFAIELGLTDIKLPRYEQRIIKDDFVYKEPSKKESSVEELMRGNTSLFYKGGVGIIENEYI